MRFSVHLQFDMRGAKDLEEARNIADEFVDELIHAMHIPIDSVHITEVEEEDD